MMGNKNEKIKRRSFKILFYLLMIVLVIYYFFPMVWMVCSSFKTNQEIFMFPFNLPEIFKFSNWREAWRIGKIGTYAKNSLIITTTTIFFVLTFASMSSFAFSRLKFRFNKILMGIFVLGLFTPVQSYFIAQNNIIKFLNFSDTRMALILPYIAMGLPLATFMLKNYFDAIPKAIEESAIIDGANTFQIYSKIMFPMIMPGLATVGIFTTLSAWNEFLLALLYIQSDKLKTLTVGMYAFSGLHTTDYALLFAGLSIVTIPMIIIYFIFNKKIIAGLTEGSVKG